MQSPVEERSDLRVFSPPLLLLTLFLQQAVESAPPRPLYLCYVTGYITLWALANHLPDVRRFCCWTRGDATEVSTGSVIGEGRWCPYPRTPMFMVDVDNLAALVSSYVTAYINDFPDYVAELARRGPSVRRQRVSGSSLTTASRAPVHAAHQRDGCRSIATPRFDCRSRDKGNGRRASCSFFIGSVSFSTCSIDARHVAPSACASVDPPSVRLPSIRCIPPV